MLEWPHACTYRFLVLRLWFEIQVVTRYDVKWNVQIKYKCVVSLQCEVRLYFKYSGEGFGSKCFVNNTQAR